MASTNFNVILYWSGILIYYKIKKATLTYY